MQTAIKPQTFFGRNFSAEDLLMIQEVVNTCGGISRYELARTACGLHFYYDIQSDTPVKKMDIRAQGQAGQSADIDPVKTDD